MYRHLTRCTSHEGWSNHMRGRFKPRNCLVVSSLVVLSLMLVPCGIVASLKMSKTHLVVNAPYVGLHIAHFPHERNPPVIAINLGVGSCQHGHKWPSMTIKDEENREHTVISIVDCDPSLCVARDFETNSKLACPDQVPLPPAST